MENFTKRNASKNIRAFRGQNKEMISRRNGTMTLMQLTNRNGVPLCSVHFEPCPIGYICIYCIYIYIYIAYIYIIYKLPIK